MKKTLRLLPFFVLMANGVYASSPNDTVPVLRDSILEGMEIISSYGNNLDSLLSLWYVQNGVDTSNMLTLVEPDFVEIHTKIPDSVYMQRLAAIHSIIDLPYNSIVRNFISVYTERQREKVEIMLGVADYYLPIFEEILDYYQLPVELRMLPVIESALNPRAVSRAGATGLWQFMYGTGRMYNLTINSYIDERCDPIASSHAAARFLRDLYKIYGDWTLVIAAYNCGPGNVNKAIRRSGGKRNYWDIYYYLPRETRGYVPAFIAATYAFEYRNEHNIKPVSMSLPATVDTLMISGMLHFNQIHEVLGVPIKVLRDLNPHYKQNVIPAQKKLMSLRLPLEQVGPFIDRQQEIFAYKDSIYFNPDNVISPSGYTASYKHEVPSGSQKVVYVVKEGDVLGTIAERHGVRVSQLRSWNNIRGNLIRVGQRLTIYVRANVASNAGYSNAATPQGGDSNFVYYKVRSGDTLWDIAKQYPGISSTDIKRINNLNTDKLIPGQVLKIKPKSS
ncbi:MAG: LysM peptidoglycan-binding domain-containing protein [Bacteroidales bacterium]|nr:LysM peptidoglycan-binding domain-containing protein [Bacteroidales bacterium]MDD3891570.1 LysM peptidoglycan-binding domain-containing protein [Bacteroidales bacterium]